MVYLPPYVKAPARWDALRRAIRTARRGGSSFTLCDGSIGYGVIYNPEKVAQSDLDAAARRHQPDVDQAGFLDRSGQLSRSVIAVNIPEPPAKEARTQLPFFLFDIPWKAVEDLIAGRLLITVFINLDALASRLSDEGYEVSKTTNVWSIEPGGFVITFRQGAKSGRLTRTYALIRPLLYEFAPLQNALDALAHLRGLLDADWVAQDEDHAPTTAAPATQESSN